MICYIASFLVVMIPLGWLMVNSYGFDEHGLALAIVIACALANALRARQFRTLIRPRQAA